MFHARHVETPRVSESKLLAQRFELCFAQPTPLARPEIFESGFDALGGQR